MVARSKKVAYFAHLEECLNKYPRAFLVDADFVGSKQISDIRIALRGKAELVFGKNTMIRRCIRNLCADGTHPVWESIVPYMVGNVGFVFTTGDLEAIEEVIKEFVKPAPAKSGVIAPCSCTIPKGPTGLDPAQTSFFQALNIATKINKGSIEIINDTTVIKEGNKVGSSEAALLAKLNVKPFQYGLSIKYVYEGGVFPLDVLAITDATLMGIWSTAMGQVVALSLGAGFPTEASLTHYIGAAIKNICAVALEADYIEFEKVTKMKDMLDNPDAYAGSGGGGDCGPGVAAAAPAAAAKAPEPEPEPEPEEEEEDMGFDLFD
jgi:large subunit ribosomal protein LP0